MFGKILDDPPLRRWIQSHPFIANVLLALGYCILGKIGFVMTGISESASAIWPPSGLTFAAVFIGGRRLLPGIYLGAFSSAALSGYGILPASTIGIGSTAEAYIALTILGVARKYRDYLGEYTLPAWLVSSSLFAPVIASIIGAYSIHYSPFIESSVSISELCLTWWTGNFIGSLIFTPVFLCLNRFKISGLWLLKFASLVLFGIATGQIIFTYGTGAPLLFLAFPMLLLACYLFGPCGSAFAVLGFCIHSTLATAQCNSSIGNSAINEQILLFNIFLFSLTITSLTISASYRKGHFLLPAAILLLGWTISGGLYYTLRSTSSEIDTAHFTDLIDDTELAISNRIDAYTHLLISSASFYQNSEEVTEEEWLGYMNCLKIQQYYPSVYGLALLLPGPDGNLDELSEINKQLLAIDESSKQTLDLSLQQARDSGKTEISERIPLIKNGEEQLGFVLSLPVYQVAMPTNTVEQRQDALIAWVSISYSSQICLQNILASRKGLINFDLYDSESIDPNHLIYFTCPHPTNKEHEPFEQLRTLDIGGKTFTFAWTRGSEFGMKQTHSALITAASLSLAICLLAGICVSLQNMNRHTNQIVESKTSELRKLNDTLQTEVGEKLKAELEAEEAQKLAESANQAKSEFLATMSHEIRTPMNSVIGFAELLSNSELNNEQRLWTNYIQLSGGGLLRIINDILDFSKIEAGKLEIEHIPFSLSQAVQEVIGSFVIQSDEKDVLLDFTADDTLPQYVLGDPTRIKQIITNLLGNAIKFTEHGSICVNIAWEGTPKEGTAQIRLRDTGVGLPPERVEHLFDKFTQADSSTTRKYGGTGLGLAICKNLAELMHGTIHAESTLGEGTTMSLSIPYQAPHENARIQEATTPFSGKIPGTTDSSLEVLLVDDSEANQQLGLAILKRLGHNVDLASNGEEAIAAVQKKCYPLIFMDCQMPVMNGFDATKEIRRLEDAGELPCPPNAQKTMIIALTASASKTAHDMCISAGMNDYISKPCRIEDFQNVFAILDSTKKTTPVS